MDDIFVLYAIVQMYIPVMKKSGKVYTCMFC